jgi:tetratricopeptide (TPR) repeat protein/predicted aspartyl protease
VIVIESVESGHEPAALRRHAWAAGLLVALGLQCPVGSHAAGCTLTTVELPVHMVGRRAIATIGINGQDVQMLVDSGAWYSTISPAAAAQLHLSPRHVPGFAMGGVVGGAEARVASADLTLIKGKVPNVQFVVGGNDLDSGAMGLLGRNILWYTDTEYDLAHGAIRFVYPSDECAKANMAYWAGNTPVSVISLQNTDPTPLAAIVASAKLNDTTIDVLFDTGATTMVSLAGAKRAGVKESDMKTAGRFSGIGRGSAQSWTASFPRFEIGGEAILNNTLWIGDYELHDADMLLGMDFFLSHRIYMSKKQSRMYFTYAGGPVFARNVEASASEPASGAAASEADAGFDADAYLRRGEASRARGNLRAALADLDRACTLDARNARCFDDRAQVHAELKERDKAAADFDTALRVDPGLVHARLGRIELRETRGDRAGAIEDLAVLDKALAPQSQTRRDMLDLYGKAGDLAGMTTQFDLWVAAHPHDAGVASAYNSRCWRRVSLGVELDKALADCNTSLELDPAVAAHVDSRAWVWLRMGQWQKSLAEFNRGLALDANVASSLYGRGIVRLHLGDKTAADADLAAARKLRATIDADMKREGLSVEQLGPRQ